MNNPPLFYRLGKNLYKRRRLIILLWLVLIVSCLPLLADLMSPFKTMGFVDNDSNSAAADLFLEERLGYGDQRIVIAYSSDKLVTDNPLFLSTIKASLWKLRDFYIPHEIIYPTKDNHQFSKNKHVALVVILFKTKEMTADDITQLKTLIKKPNFMHLTLGGEPIFIDDVNNQTRKDLYKADIIAVPVSIIIMILVFGSLIAAFIPIVLGGGAAVVILTSLYCLAHFLSLSIFTINISLLLGLCLSLDYCLFFMSRFREELHKQLPMEVIIGTTMNSAGRAIFYSGIAVFISLSALLIFPVPILFSIGIGGLAAVFFAVCISLIFLPALLSVIRGGINRLAIRSFKSKKHHGRFWRWLAEKVVKRPLLFFFPSLMFLLFLSLPFLNVKFGISDAHILPHDSASHQFLNIYKANFNENNLSPLIIIASSGDNILSNTNLTDLYELTKQLEANPFISEVTSIMNVDKKIPKNQYYPLYHIEKKYRDKTINQLLDTTTGRRFTIINIVSKYSVNSSETKQLVKQLQEMSVYKHLRLQATGIPVNNAEVMDKISQLFPFALLWILCLTYLILLLLLHSLLLPFKALLMNIISLSASYGVLVFVFQEGYLQDILAFVPQKMLDTSLLIIIFCALFGFSMDYEVFLLTRMKECYEKTKNTRQSVISGIDQSGRLITSAAIIVIVLCGSFMAAEVLMVKEFGLGIAIAIFVDAFLVRSLLEPSLTVLLGKWNWYIPNWLEKMLPKAYDSQDQQNR